jgi:hypothetical protein
LDSRLDKAIQEADPAISLTEIYLIPNGSFAPNLGHPEVLTYP